MRKRRKVRVRIPIKIVRDTFLDRDSMDVSLVERAIDRKVSRSTPEIVVRQ